MLFVVDQPRFERMIAIARDDHGPAAGAAHEPFLRIEAAADYLRISGREVEAQFPATVYEPGVLFLRVSLFRQCLSGFTLEEMGTRHMTFQVSEQGLSFGNVRMGFNLGDMLLYPDPATAPSRHPEERIEAPAPKPDPQGTLFDLR